MNKTHFKPECCYSLIFTELYSHQSSAMESLRGGGGAAGPPPPPPPPPPQNSQLKQMSQISSGCNTEVEKQEGSVACASVPYFKIKSRLICCPLLFKEHNPQFRLNKTVNEQVSISTLILQD